MITRKGGEVMGIARTGIATGKGAGGLSKSSHAMFNKPQDATRAFPSSENLNIFH